MKCYYSGILTGDPINPRRRDVDAERVLYFESIDEGLSLLTQRNLGLCGNPTLCRQLYNDHDDAFMVIYLSIYLLFFLFKKVQVGNDQENVQSKKEFSLQKPIWEKLN